MTEKVAPLAPINLVTQGKEIENILREAGRQALGLTQSSFVL